MIISRGVSCLRILNRVTKTSPGKCGQPVRHGSDLYYRTAPADAPKFNLMLGEALGGLFWWWVLWHVFTEPEHLLGEFPYPDPSKWTDEELGISPD